MANCYIWNITLGGVETWTLQKVDHKYLRSSQVWCRRRLDMGWIDQLRH